jgi:L-ascorbate metabolism protein UlaG (beta-lactamase superfamily)
MGDLTIFHGGDSGYVPLKDYPTSIAFLPTGAPSPTCSPEEAFKMALDLKPSVVVTMHGNNYDNEEVKQKLKKNMPKTVVVMPIKQVTRRIKIFK